MIVSSNRVTGATGGHGSNVKENQHDLVDVDRRDIADVLADTSVEDAVGALDWLLNPLDSGGGWSDDWSDDSVDGQADFAQSLGVPEKLDHAALSYGASQDGGQHERLRWIGSEAAIELAEDHFGGDDDAVFLAVVVRDIVSRALLKNDAWCFEWIFGAAELQSKDRPSRQFVMEFFEAREVVLQTRVQFQMLMDARTYKMPFLCKGMDRSFLWQLTSMLAEKGPLIGLDHGLTVMEQMWRNPGISEPALWKLYQKHVTQASRMALKSDKMAFEAALVFFELGYVASRHEKTGNWYLTGKNPVRYLEDMRRDMQRYNIDTMNRGWSSWW